MRVVVADFGAGGVAGGEAVEVAATGADQDLAEAVDAVGDGDAARIHALAALVVVVVADQDQIHLARMQRVIGGLHGAVAGVVADAPARMVEVGRGAGLGVRGQILLQPGQLGAGNGAVGHGVERDEVPIAHVVAVVALAAVAGGACIQIGLVRAQRVGGPVGTAAIEVVEVPLRARSVVVVVAGCRAGEALEPTPTRVIEIVVLDQGAVLVSVVACGEHRDRVDLDDQVRGCRAISGRRVADVARAGDHGRGRAQRLGAEGVAADVVAAVAVAEVRLDVHAGPAHRAAGEAAVVPLLALEHVPVAAVAGQDQAVVGLQFQRTEIQAEPLGARWARPGSTAQRRFRRRS